MVCKISEHVTIAYIKKVSVKKLNKNLQ